MPLAAVGKHNTIITLDRVGKSAARHGVSDNAFAKKLMISEYFRNIQI
jgi:hypothetical protein